MNIPFISKNREEHKEKLLEQVKNQKRKFNRDMTKLKTEAQDIHVTSVKSLKASRKLNKSINDLASQLAIILTE